MRIKVLGPNAILLAGRYEIRIFDHGDPNSSGRQQPQLQETQKIPSIKSKPKEGDKIRNISGLHATTIKHIEQHSDHGYLITNDEGEKMFVLPEPVGTFDKKPCWQEGQCPA